MNTKFAGILAFVFLLSLFSVSAQQFNVEITEVNNRISIDEFAVFQFTITNNGKIADEYRISNLNFPTWDVRTDPISNPITVELEPNETGSVEFLVDPLKIRDIGTYAVHVNVRSKETNAVQTIPLKVIVLSTDTLIQGYVPTVVTSVNVPEKIDPRESIPIRVVLNNQNVIKYDELVVRLESELINEEIRTPLDSKEEKVLEITTSIDRLTAPRTDNLIATVYLEDRSIINPQIRVFEVTEWVEDKHLGAEKGFLTETNRYEISSNNQNYAGEFKVETSLFNSIFSSEKPNAKLVKEGSERFIVWNVELDGNAAQVSVRKNFVPLFVVIVILIVLLIVYLLLRSPMVIIKEAGNLVRTEGGISDISIIIHVKNRGQKKLNHIEITDLIPSLVSVEREVSIGSLQPSKILKHSKKGHTVVKWDIEQLEPSEERVLTYKMKSKLSILGSFNLPSATGVFKQDKRTMTTSSNSLQVNE